MSQKRGYFFEVVREYVRPIERKLILEALMNNDWNRKKSSKVLGMSYRSMLMKIKELKINSSSETALRKPEDVAVESHSPA